MISCISSVVASRMSWASLRSTLMAPRRAKSRFGMVGDSVRARAGFRPRPRSTAGARPASGRRAAAGRSPRAAARARGDRRPRTCAAPDGCAPRGSSSSIRSAPTQAHAGGRGAAILELHPVAQASQALLPDRPAADLRAVGLRHPEARVGQPVGELAVVGQQDQAAASRRPAGRPGTGAAPARARARPRSGGRGCRCAVETTPTGLCTAYRTRGSGPRARGRRPPRGSSSPTSRAGSVTISPSTLTRPAADQRLGRAPARRRPRGRGT